MLISVERTDICLVLHAWYPHCIQMKYYKHSTLIFAVQRYMFWFNEPSSGITLQTAKQNKYTHSLHYWLVRSHWFTNIY
jgi:hypothetical protein